MKRENKVCRKIKFFYDKYFVLRVTVRQLAIVILAGCVMCYNVYLGNMVLLFLTLVVNDTIHMYGWKQFSFLCLIFFFLTINAIFAYYSL